MSKYSKFKKKPKMEGPLSIGGDVYTRDMLTHGQKGAEALFDKWFKTKKSKRQQILRVGGGSGSGKSVFIKYLVDKYGFDKSECYVVSYTGQSVNVLRSRGLMSTTIHSAFMVPQEETILKDGKPIFRRGVPLTTVKFRPIPYIPPCVKLIIVDEASFLPEDLERTLCRYNIPILEVGDPIQLPPVGGKQVFHLDNLDYFIEGVMRQNANSEIYKLGTAFRRGERIDINAYGNEVRFLHQQETIEDTFYQFLPILRRADLIVTSTNKQRQVITDLYRKEIIGTTSPYPREGERMICRRNNPVMTLGDFMLTNGTQGVCLSSVGHSMVDSSTKTFCMDFKPDVVAGTDLYYDNLICDADFLKQPFGSDTMTSFRHPGDKFEYAHAITTHLIQGGSAPVVFFMDSLSRDREYLNRLRYTAATRAEMKLYYAIPYRGEWSL
ncbi:MAG: AAA family ATPase [Ruminococcus flavefaciens]|nr:AAA family ATPase [Ruminococcus flavefaciens]